MLDARFVPLLTWPLKSKGLQTSPFRAGYNDSLDLLERELQHLSARDIVIQAGFDRAMLRNDGWPKVGVRPQHSGVILSFEAKTGPLSFPCRTYTTYEANIRAIALSLESLRAVDRYGVTQAAEQYKGWSQLPAPGSVAHFQSAEDAAKFLLVQSRAGYAVSEIIHREDLRKRVYRDAAYHLHPDRGGNPEQFALLQEALAILGAK